MENPQSSIRSPKFQLMKALVFHPTIPRFAITKALSAVNLQALWGSFSPLQYREIPEPPLPGDDWVRVAVRLGGICGSDLHTIHLDASPSISALKIGRASCRERV